MSELTEALRTHGQQHRGADLGGVLQWAALHIEAQDEAMAELRAEHAAEEAAEMMGCSPSTIEEHARAA